MKGVIWRSQTEPLHELQLQTLTCFRLQTWFGVNGDGFEGDDSAEETAAAEREMSAQNHELQLCPLLLSRSGKALLKKTEDVWAVSRPKNRREDKVLPRLHVTLLWNIMQNADGKNCPGCSFYLTLDFSGFNWESVSKKRCVCVCVFWLPLLNPQAVHLIIWDLAASPCLCMYI